MKILIHGLAVDAEGLLTACLVAGEMKVRVCIEAGYYWSWVFHDEEESSKHLASDSVGEDTKEMLDVAHIITYHQVP